MEKKYKKAGVESDLDLVDLGLRRSWAGGNATAGGLAGHFASTHPQARSDSQDPAASYPHSPAHRDPNASALSHPLTYTRAGIGVGAGDRFDHHRSLRRSMVPDGR